MSSACGLSLGSLSLVEFDQRATLGPQDDASFASCFFLPLSPLWRVSVTGLPEKGGGTIRVRPCRGLRA